MSIPKRFQAKLYFDDSVNVPIKDFIPVFHKWIQDQKTGDLLIDVHNYSHVHHGPGILLVAHESDYAVDLDDGRTGLVYRRKRSVPDSMDALVRLVFQRLVYGAIQLTEDDSLPGKVRFLTNEIELSILDRLQYPNDEDAWSRIEPELQKAATQIFGEDKVTLERVENDPREPLTVRLLIASPPVLPELADLLNNGVAS